MRIQSLIIAIIFSGAAAAQNWALLNPAYRYNYSDDGTDTISNQIRVMHVDTLGVDSFRYELNLVAVVCDTCPAIGGVCAGCFVRVGQPQFLGFECVKMGSDWYFFGVDTFMIRSSAGLSAAWAFDASNGITATVDAEWVEDFFGPPDTLRRIVLSSQDTLVLSRSFGIRRFARGANSVELIGVEGPGVGRVYPDPLAYFDYQPGDELTYWVVADYYIIHLGGGEQYYDSHTVMWKVRITERTDSPDGIEYGTSWAWDYPSSANISYTLVAEPDWPVPFEGWSIQRNEILLKHPLLGAYPGQVLDTSVCEHATNIWFDPKYIAKYGIAPSGRAEMRYLPIGQSPGQLICGFNAASEVSPGLHSRQSAQINAWYEEGVGLRMMQYREPSTTNWLHIELVGAIIGGDTLIPPQPWNWDVGISEARVGSSVFPSPASDFIQLQQCRSGAICSIADMNGRLVLTQRINSSTERIEVSGLSPGIYVVSVDGIIPQRLIIAR